MLAISQLEAGYGHAKVVQGVSFELAAGQISAVLGPNGAGKTTTLRAISGAVERFGGEVRLDGERLPARPAAVAASGVAHVPQGRLVFADLTVVENLLTGTMHLPRGDAAAEVERVLALLPALRRLAGRRAGLLSGGEQQMLSIGRALVSRPKVLMIDELSLGLAPKVIAGFGPILEQLAGSGMAILMVEQYVTFARQVASRLILMTKGRVVLDGATSDVDEESLLRASYLGAAA
jgi:branched-chain amino acid transport system ATP-binding protein